jgi:hypothetical protein
MFGDLIKINYIGLDSIALALNFELHSGHSVPVVVIFDVGRDVQHF